MTRDEVIEEFVESGSHDRVQLTILVDAMIGRQHPIFAHITMTPLDAYKLIEQFGLLEQHGHFGWITPSGEFLSCDHAAHDRLLYCLGIRTWDAEKQGWVRVGDQLIQGMFRLTMKQRRVLRRLERDIDEQSERRKPLLPGHLRADALSIRK